jgi:hypothetical protein
MKHVGAEALGADFERWEATTPERQARFLAEVARRQA